MSIQPPQPVRNLSAEQLETLAKMHIYTAVPWTGIANHMNMEYGLRLTGDQAEAMLRHMSRQFPVLIAEVYSLDELTDPEVQDLRDRGYPQRKVQQSVNNSLRESGSA